MKTLLDAIQNVISLTREEEHEISRRFYITSLKKNEFAIEAGEYCEKIFFIKKGTLRIYYLDEKGEEITCFFAQENQFLSSYSSFLTHTPTKENIQAIEDCTLICINRKDLEAISNRVPKFHEFRRIMAENLFIAMERRVAMLQSQSAQEAYESLIKETPTLLHNIPQQYLASFLGITPQHLSRIRKGSSL